MLVGLLVILGCLALLVCILAVGQFRQLPGSEGQPLVWDPAGNGSQGYVPAFAPYSGSGGSAPGSTGFAALDNFNRTSDTNAYTAGDVIGTGTGAGGAVLTFANLGPIAGGVLYITDVDMLIALTSVPAGMTSFRLHLYDASPPSALGDNAAWTLASGDEANYLGYVDLGTQVAVTGTALFVQSVGVNKSVKMASGSQTVYGYLVTNGGYTPASGTIYQVRFRGTAL